MKIAVIGNCSDIELFEQNQKIAKHVGEIIARLGFTLLFSIENDLNSLPIIAALSAKKNNGKTIGFTHSNETQDKLNASTEIIVTGMQRGGPREFILISSADVIIAIGGGSGTLMELSMSYQQNKKIIAIKNTGGWAEKIPEFIDQRKRVAINKININDLEGELIGEKNAK